MAKPKPIGPRTIQVNTKEIQNFVAKQGGPVDRKMGLLADRMLQEAVSRAPVGKKPSPMEGPRLVETLRLRRFERSDGSVVYVVGSDTVKMKYVTGGTPPHIIRARKGKALSFFWENAGRQFIGKSVNHPGISENPTGGNVGVNNFLREAYNAVRDSLK